MQARIAAGAPVAARRLPRWALAALALLAILLAIALVPAARRAFAPPPPPGAAASRVLFPSELAGRGRVSGTIAPVVVLPSVSPTAKPTATPTAAPSGSPSAAPSAASTGGAGAGEPSGVPGGVAGGVPGGVVGGTGTATPVPTATRAPTPAPTATPPPTPVGTATPAPDEDVITFTILDLNTRAPIADVCVVVGTGECSGVKSYYTDANGQWSFAVPRQTTVYDFRFYKSGYTPKPYQFTHVAGRDPDQTTVFMH